MTKSNSRTAMRFVVRSASQALLSIALSLQFNVSVYAAKQPIGEPFEVSSSRGDSLTAVPLASFDQPWAMTFLPDGRLLVAEKPGNLWLLGFSATLDNAERVDSADTDIADTGEASNALTTLVTTVDQHVDMSVVTRIEVSGLPPIDGGGQGGLGDIILHPGFNDNNLVYFSYVEREGGLSGAVVASARLDQRDSATASLSDTTVIWRQSPKVSGQGHYGYRLAFSPDGFLFITSGERQKFDPAQDMQSNLGKVIRLHDDGSVPADNPFATSGGVAAQVWSLGHRNPLGIAFDQGDNLWVHEMGPRGGDELNLIQRGANFGYPLVSNGDHYSGGNIPDHDTRPEFQAPAISWTPVISPSSLVVYTGKLYKGWQGTGIMGGLSSQSLVRVVLDNPSAEIERYDMRQRIREVEQGPAGFLYVLEDGNGGRLLKMIP